MPQTFKKILISLKNYLPCRDLNLGSPEYEADVLPIEPSGLGCSKKRSNLKSLLDCFKLPTLTVPAKVSKT